MMSLAVGPNAVNVDCPFCRANVVTKVELVSTRKTHIVALLLCVFLCWPCACVPYCTSSCRNSDHYCPSCHAYIGSYRR